MIKGKDYYYELYFCRIAAGEIPSQRYMKTRVFAFRDINPVAPVHILDCSQNPYPGADVVSSENSSLVARIFEVIPKIAATEGLSRGYRVVTNVGEDGGQTVMHLHFHLIGGRKLDIMA